MIEEIEERLMLIQSEETNSDRYYTIYLCMNKWDLVLINQNL